MTENGTASRLAIAIHDDIGALLALAIALRRRRIDLFPARTVTDALRLLSYDERPPDILIVNSAIDGSLAFAKTLCQRHPALKAIGILEDAFGCVRDQDFLAATLAPSQCSISSCVRTICSLA